MSDSSHVYVALLRGINVGGHNKVRMKELVAALEAAGLEEVNSYIQSGNLVFRAPGSSNADDMTAKIETTLQDSFSVQAPAMVLEAKDYVRALDQFPFAEEQSDTSVFVFLSGEGSGDWAERARQHIQAPDRLEVINNTAYLTCPNGISKSKAAEVLLAKPTNGIKATMRNWRTVNKIAEMLSELS